MASLSSIPDGDIPTKETDVRAYWRALRPVAQLYNALMNFQVTRENADSLTISEGNAILALKNSGASASAIEINHPWKPYLSPTATGEAAARTIRIRMGTVNGEPPATPNLEIIIPANQTDGYFVWLDADIDADGNVIGYDYGHGATLPDPPELPTDGTPPVKAYDCLFVVTSAADAVDLPANSQLRWSPLTLLPVETDRTTTEIERRMKYEAPGGLEDIPA